MEKVWGRLGDLVTNAARRTKVRKGLVGVVAAFVILQLYFVRELLAAELLFGLLFASLLLLAGVCYLLGALGERGLDWTEAGVRVVAQSARRGYSAFEEFSRKPFRNPGSESAQ
jgi:hypothetical protein